MEDIKINKTLDELVFEDRNRRYGSYFLRVKYGEYLTQAFVISLTIFLLFVFSPKIKDLYDKYFANQATEEVVVETEVIAELQDVPIEKDMPPPPPLKVEPPKIEAVKFLPPDIKPDKEVRNDELPPKTEALDTTNIASVNQEGEKSLNDMIEDNTGGGVVGGTAEDDNKIYTFVGEYPEFPGGIVEMMKFLRKNVIYPQDALAKDIQGTVVVAFTIEKSGEVVDVRVIKGISSSMDKEAERVVKMMPRWKPGKNNGNPVRFSHKVPIKFVIPD